MKKFLILILICLAQNIFAQNAANNSKTKNTKPVVSKNTNLETEEPLKQDIAAKNKIYNIDSIQVKPDFEGGIQKFHKFIRYNFKYPDEELQVKGTVEVNFIVEKDGTLSNIKVTKDAGYGTGTEAIRILKKSPKWIPGTHEHRLVRTLYYLSIPIN